MHAKGQTKCKPHTLDDRTGPLIQILHRSHIVNQINCLLFVVCQKLRFAEVKVMHTTLSFVLR